MATWAGVYHNMPVTRVSLNSEVEHELSLYLGPVQNQNLHFRGPKYGCRLRHSAQAYKENTQDIGLDTFPSLVSISELRECIYFNLTHLKPSSSEDALTCVLLLLFCCLLNL